MKETKLRCLTHGGVIHADEKLAIGWLEIIYGQEAEVIFSYKPTPEQLADPDLHVLDVGGQYNPGLNNRDHHHDANLPATNLMVLRDFPHPIESLNKVIEEWLFGYVDKVDRGEIVEGSKGAVTLNTLIRMVNAVPGLDDKGRHELAMDLIRPVLHGLVNMHAKYEQTPFQKNQYPFEVKEWNQQPRETEVDKLVYEAIHRLAGEGVMSILHLWFAASDQNWLEVASYVVRCAVEKRIADEARWNNEVQIEGHYATHDSTDQISDWRDYADTSGVSYLLTPNLRGGWQILSISSETHPIPVHHAQTFRHNSGFLAVYSDRDSAIAHAKLLK